MTSTEHRIQDLPWLLTTLDCGDHGCLFRDLSKPSGLRTNGGCSCFDELGQKKKRFVMRMFHELRGRSGYKYPKQCSECRLAWLSNIEPGVFDECPHCGSEEWEEI